MLQTDEVDDDYFTPIASTSLANIFGNVAQSKEQTGNEKLKYTPPKPQNIQKEPVQVKTTECLFACAVDGHEWSNYVYTSRGKLGFAIIKIQKTGDHNIVLYDSNKTTVSCTVISPKLEISIKNNSYISYYDNLQKYWSIYAVENDAKKILEMLTMFDVITKPSINTTEPAGPPEPRTVEQDVSKPSGTNLESDTDSLINKKTKALILNRMANMGHSVLPMSTVIADRSSGSSDTNETERPPKIVRHKPVKSIVKKNIEHNIQSEHSTGSYHKRNIPITEQSIDNTLIHTSVSRPLVPMSNTNFITGFNCNSNNDLGIFMSEQRISNSELRLNMGRITDKVDIIIDKVSNFEHKGANLQTDILMKLLTEYESKIKVYEELLKSNNVDTTQSRDPNKENETEILRNTIQSLEQEIKDKSHEILVLQNEIQLLKQKHDEEKVSQADNEDVLHKKVSNLESSLAANSEELMKLREKCDNLSSNTNISIIDMGNKLKNIMNDTFQTISVNFDEDEVYDGKTVKKIIAAVIKKITMESLSEL